MGLDFHVLEDLRQYFLFNILTSEPTLKIQIINAFIGFLICQVIYIPLARGVADALSIGKEWHVETIMRAEDYLKKTQGVILTTNDAHEKWLTKWGVCTHHYICTLMVLPIAILGSNRERHYILVRHAASFELGFEVSNLIARLYERFSNEDGRLR